MKIGISATTPETYEAAYKDSFENVQPKLLQKVEEIAKASKGKFLFGDKLCCADFWIGGYYVNNCVNPNIPFGKEDG